MRVNELADRMNKLFKDKSYLKKVYKRAGDINDVIYYFASALQHEIVFDGEVEIKEPEMCIPKSLSNPIYGNISVNTLYNRVVENGIMTHAFNGAYLKDVKKYGLGNNNLVDETLNKNLEDLENVLGKSQFSEYQTNQSDEIYFCSPGAKTFYYALTCSPERLYNGILKQFIKRSDPVVIGEKKEDYMRKVLYRKIDEAKAEELPEGLKGSKFYKDRQNMDVKLLKSKADYVVEKLCCKNPIVALFPIKSKKYDLDVCYATTKEDDIPVKLVDYVKDQMYNRQDPFFYFTSSASDYVEKNGLDNLVSLGTVIPPEELGLVEVPGRYEIVQEYAKTKGLKEGDKINLYSFEPIK